MWPCYLYVPWKFSLRDWTSGSSIPQLSERLAECKASNAVWWRTHDSWKIVMPERNGCLSHPQWGRKKVLVHIDYTWTSKSELLSFAFCSSWFSSFLIDSLWNVGTVNYVGWFVKLESHARFHTFLDILDIRDRTRSEISKLHYSGYPR